MLYKCAVILTSRYFGNIGFPYLTLLYMMILSFSKDCWVLAWSLPDTQPASFTLSSRARTSHISIHVFMKTITSIHNHKSTDLSISTRAQSKERKCTSTKAYQKKHTQTSVTWVQEHRCTITRAQTWAYGHKDSHLSLRVYYTYSAHNLNNFIIRYYAFDVMKSPYPSLTILLIHEFSFDLLSWFEPNPIALTVVLLILRKR